MQFTAPGCAAHCDGFGGRYELQFVLYDVFIILRTTFPFTYYFILFYFALLLFEVGVGTRLYFVFLKIIARHHMMFG